MQQCPKLVMLSTAMVRAEDILARVVCTRAAFPVDSFFLLHEVVAGKRRAQIIE
jgi:hypothetical protein